MKNNYSIVLIFNLTLGALMIFLSGYILGIGQNNPLSSVDISTICTNKIIK